MGIKAYKGFNRDMTCRGFQFEEGKIYQEESAKLCKNGFHACENPLDCFMYYTPAESVYHEVELEAVSNEHEENDSKICGKIIKIGARLDVASMCRLHFDFVKQRTTNQESGENNANLSGKDCSSLSAQKHSSLSAQNRSSLSAQKHSSLSAQDCSSLSAQDCSSLSAQDGSRVSAGKNSVISAVNSTVRAGLGSVITLAKREWQDFQYVLTDFASGIVDGKRIKADTWYKLENGSFVEEEAQED